MNKKFLVALVITGIMLTMVNAGLMLYYAQITATIEVTQPITVIGDLEYTFDGKEAGDSFLGHNNMIINNGDSEKIITLSNNAPEGIYVSYQYEYMDFVYHDVEVGEPIILSAPTDTSVDDKVRIWVSYELDSMLETGTYTVTTTIDDVE